MILNDFAPSIIEINSLGIGLLNHSNIDTLNLTENEYLVVGEKYNTGDTNDNLDKLYSLIVNNDGVAINATRRAVNAVNTSLKDSTDKLIGTSALYVGNNIICDGNIMAKGLIIEGITLADEIDETMLSELINKVNQQIQPFPIGYGNYKNGPLPQYSDSTDYSPSSILVDNIYTTSYVTIGSKNDTFANTNPLNIVATANNNIKNTHISIKNNNSGELESSSLRIGIVGDSYVAPAIISTTPGLALEFHIGRTTADFNVLYSDETGVPNYSKSNSITPSMIINTDGNIIAGGSNTESILYNKINRIDENSFDNILINKVPKMKVEGAVFIDDIITYDYYTDNNLHLDDIYIRKLGLNFEANQIKPGIFTKGNFNFNGNVTIGNVNDEYVLEVNKFLNVNGNLNVSNEAFFNKIEVNDATFNNNTIFNNDIVIGKDIIINRNLSIEENGDLFIHNTRINIANVHPMIIEGDQYTPDEETNYTILFSASDNVLNIEGSNLAVPGRLGTGINSTDEYNEQFNVIKRSPFNFELMLQDSSKENADTPISYMGHIEHVKSYYNKDILDDNSLIINTNKIRDLHNIYFYAGRDILRDNYEDSIPNLTIHQNNKIGINNKNPLHTLDINGDMLCNDIYLNKNSIDTKALLFLYKRNEGSLQNDYTKDVFYLYDDNVDKFCINFAKTDNVDIKSLNVKGGIHSIEGGFYEDNVKIETLKTINSKSVYTLKNICIGTNADNLSSKPLNIRSNNFDSYNDSIIRIYRGATQTSGNKVNNALFSGIDICEYKNRKYVNENIIDDKNRDLFKWFMYKNHYVEESDNNNNKIGPLHFGYTNGTHHPTHFGMTMYFNKNNSNYFIDVNNPKIDDNIDDRKSAMKIYGGLDVYGDINIIDIHGSNYNYKRNGIVSSLNAISDLPDTPPNPDIPTEPNVVAVPDSDSQDECETTYVNDVVITGNKIALIPKNNIIIGHNDMSFVNYIKNIGSVGFEEETTPLIVYQNKNNNPVSKFYSSYKDEINNTSIIELGIIKTGYAYTNSVNDKIYSSEKCNTVSFAVSAYKNKDDNKTLLQFKNYNKINNVDDKFISFYNNDNNSYIYIGNNDAHSQTTGELFIGDIDNVAVHIDKKSKYLLQLTNDTLSPAINLHKISNDLNNYWIIEGPTDNGSLIFKNSNSNVANNPSNNVNEILAITVDKKIGINNTVPENTVDIKSANNTPSMRLINNYDNDYVYNNYSAISTFNSNLDFSQIIDSDNDNLYSFDTSNYYSGIKYILDTSTFDPLNYPDKDIDGNEVLYEYLINSNYIVNKKINLTKEFVITKDYDIEITSNFEYLELINSEYKNYIVFEESLLPSVTNNNIINFKSSNILIPPIRKNNNEFITHITDYNYVNILNNNLITSTIVVDNITIIYNYDYDITLLNNYNYNCNINTIFDYNISGSSTKNVELYTSNIVNHYLSFDNQDDTIDIYTNNVITTKSDFINKLYSVYNINNYVITSNIYHYNAEDTFAFNFIANIKRVYNFNSEIEGPYSIIKNESDIVINQDIDILENNVYNVSNYVDFLQPVPYGLYEFYTFAENKIIHKMNESSFSDTFELFNNIYNIDINLFDNYYVYFFEDDDNVRNIYLYIQSLKYQPHLILQNNYIFDNSIEKTYGAVNKIYSKNGNIEFMVEDETYDKKLFKLDKHGDAYLDGTINVDNIVVNGSILDRLGNDMVLNYTEEMYRKAFILQTSNYILYTSNYNINSSSNIIFHSDSNINFSLYDGSFNIFKQNIYDTESLIKNYEILNIFEDERKVLSIANGGKIGINVSGTPTSELDVNGTIKSDFIITNGSLITDINLSDKSTDELTEGVNNLYYTQERVDTSAGLVSEASNLLTSNYIKNTSNELYYYINYYSNILTNDIKYTSNELNTKINTVDYNISNYILNENVDINQNISNYINITSNNLYELINSTSNSLNIFIEDNSNSNVLIVENINTLSYNLQNNDSYVSNYINILTTDNITETITNKYYTDDLFISSINNITLDNILTGTSNVFLSKNLKNSDTFGFSTINADDIVVDNITVNGIFTFSGTYVQQNVQESTARFINIQGTSDNNPSLIISKPQINNDNLLMDVYNYNDSDTSNLNIFSINCFGNIGINKNPNDDRTIKLNIDGNLKATKLYGDGNNITNLNLSYYNTANLAEGTNLYYTNARANTRAGLISAGSNVLTSNYVLNSSNAISTRITNLNTSAIAEDSSSLYYTDARADTRAGLVSESSNVLTSNYVLNSSNAISARINTLNTDTLVQGANNKFIINDTYDNDLYINGTLTASNLNVVGTTTTISTSTYQTEALEIITNSIDSPAITIIQNGTQNLLEAFDNDTRILSILNNGNMGLGITNPVKRLELDGDLSFTGSINSITSNELNYLSGVSNPLQNQIDNLISNINSLTTADVSEDSSRLYYTDVRADTRAGLVSEGSNVLTSNYVLNSSNAISARITNLDTSAIAEDSSRLYYTDDRADIRAGLVSESSNVLTSNYVLNSSNEICDFIKLKESIITTLPVTKGGTGLSSINLNQILYGNESNAINSSANLTFSSDTLTVIGDINATGDVISSYSDMRLKNDLGTIENSIEKIEKLRGFYYTANDIAKNNGINDSKINIGLSAQDVQSVLPEIVKYAPFDTSFENNGDTVSKSGEKYLTISYERLVPLLIEGIKELNNKFNELKSLK